MVYTAAPAAKNGKNSSRKPTANGDINAKDNIGETLAAPGCPNEKTEVVELLLKQGVDTNAKDRLQHYCTGLLKMEKL